MQLFSGNDKRMPLTKKRNQEGGRHNSRKWGRTMRNSTQERCERTSQDDGCLRSGSQSRAWNRNSCACDLLEEGSQEKARGGNNIGQGKETNKDVDSVEEQLSLIPWGAQLHKLHLKARRPDFVLLDQSSIDCERGVTSWLKRLPFDFRWFPGEGASVRNRHTEQLQDGRPSPVRASEQGTNRNHYDGENLSHQRETGIEGKTSRLEKIWRFWERCLQEDKTEGMLNVFEYIERKVR